MQTPVSSRQNLSNPGHSFAPSSPSRKTGKAVRFTSLAYYARIVEGEEVVAVAKTDGRQSGEMKLKNGSGEIPLRISGRQVQVTLTLRTDNQKMHAPEVISLKLKFDSGR